MVAAVVLVVLGSAGWLFKDDIKNKSYKTGFAETQRLELSDGSTVILNANSTLYMPRFGFAEKSREVYLTGEASFIVRHAREAKKFVVHIDKAFGY